jgi:glycosyltransferase involved in cell wall biosynthesis
MNPLSLKGVVHLIPFDAVGGVESAALSMRKVRTENVDFRVQVMFPGEMNKSLRRKSLNPFAFIKATLRLANQAPDLVIVSLWRAAVVGILFKLVQPKTKLVVFLHCALRVHLMDFWVTAIAIRIASEIWSDSAATIEATAPVFLRSRCKTVSYIPRSFEPVTSLTPTSTFIFWGRLAKQKNLQRAIRIFATVHERFPAARFTIIGPDGGEGHALKSLCRTLGVHDAVNFLGPKSNGELPEFARRASFFLLTSDFEGMGLAVVEAMQMGLVPIVTQVGEVARFCKDGINAIVIDRENRAIEMTFGAIEGRDLFVSLRARAISTWSGNPTYRDSVLGNCARLLGR